MTPPRREPTAELRASLIQMRGIYVAAVEAGFSEGEALQLVVAMIQQAMKNEWDT